MVEENEKKKILINFKRSAKFFVAFALINFLFFGLICNSGVYSTYQMDPGQRLLFVYRNLWNFDTNLYFYPQGLKLPAFLDFFIGVAYESDNITSKIPGATAMIILILIGIYQGYKEDFMVYSIKNTFWMTPFIVFLSIFWSAITYGAQRNFFQLLGDYFLNVQGYINIVVIAILYTGSGIIGGILKNLNYQKNSLPSQTQLESTTAEAEIPQESSV